MIKDTFTDAFAKETKRIKDDTPEAIRAVAAELLEEAQTRVPVVTGELRESGEVVDDPEGADVRFGAEYAEEVHENPESTGFRFLESVVDERSGALPDDVAEEVRRNG